MKVRAHVYVSGRVQGVFFRLETKEKADDYGIKGWVRNLPDGRVEAVFEGEKEKVDKIIEFCRHGPPDAMVKNVEIIWEEWKGEFKDFRIKYGF
ncbi:MAG: acylphosphatase [Candidatus Bathyarchaeia archaeon]